MQAFFVAESHIHNVNKISLNKRRENYDECSE